MSGPPVAEATVIVLNVDAEWKAVLKVGSSRGVLRNRSS